MHPMRDEDDVICRRRIELKKWILATLFSLSSVSAFGSNATGQITEVRGGHIMVRPLPLRFPRSHQASLHVIP